jgi:hypothetical protein
VPRHWPENRLRRCLGDISGGPDRCRSVTWSIRGSRAGLPQTVRCELRDEQLQSVERIFLQNRLFNLACGSVPLEVRRYRAWYSSCAISAFQAECPRTRHTRLPGNTARRGRTASTRQHVLLAQSKLHAVCCLDYPRQTLQTFVLGLPSRHSTTKVGRRRPQRAAEAHKFLSSLQLLRMRCFCTSNSVSVRIP